MRVALVVGARPNFVKAAPVRAALVARNAEVALVHTGQHFDQTMSGVFFELLGLPLPDYHLSVGSKSRAEQFAGVVSGLSRVIQADRVDRVLVVGDVTSTAAGAVAADMCDVPVDHIEAGLRSFDLSMPEERNRKIADAIADLLFVSEPAGVENLLREGKPRQRIHHVGNVMIDSLRRCVDSARAQAPWLRYGLAEKGYAVATIHRPANVDRPEALRTSIEIVGRMAARLPVVFPVHPRTRERLAAAGLDNSLTRNVIPTEPLDYFEFVGLVAGARVVVTDSGGLQEETTVLDVPCLTMRENTERPITLVDNGGTSELVNLDPARISECLDQILAGKWPPGRVPELWDGHAADRIAQILTASGR